MLLVKIDVPYRVEAPYARRSHLQPGHLLSSCPHRNRRYFQHAHFIPIVGVGKRGEYQLVHGDLLRQHSFGTTLRFTGPVLVDSRQ